MSELATRTNWRQPITGYKSNSGGRKGRKQAEKPTLTEQGIDVDEFIRENHARIQRLRETTPRNRKPEPTYRKVYETWLEQSKTGHPSERSIAKALGKSVSTIHHHVTNLVRDGYLAKDTIREREYVLTGKPFNPIGQGKAKQSPDTLARIREETVRLQNEGVAFDPAEYARIISERVGKSEKTVRNNFATLRKEGVLPPAENPFAGQRKPKPEPEPKPAANKEEPMSQELTANAVTAPEKQCENPRAIIANALVGIYDSISALQRAAYQANDKVVYGFATKLMNGELMDIKANYSKDTK
jgi:DNA-binding Lrp family transcriptional regulator|nr:MAG TPA: Selenocysteine-specific elongation factor [Caudoviricetes sp.]